MSRMPEHQKLEPGQCRPCRNRSKGWFLRFVVFRCEWSSRSISGEAGVLLTIITCGCCRSESSVWTLDWVILASAMNFNLNVCNFNFRLYASRDNSQLSCKVIHGDRRQRCLLVAANVPWYHLPPGLHWTSLINSHHQFRISSNQLCH